MGRKETREGYKKKGKEENMERGRDKKWKDKFGMTAGKRKEERTHCEGGSDVENMEGGNNEGEKER